MAGAEMTPTPRSIKRARIVQMRKTVRILIERGQIDRRGMQRQLADYYRVSRARISQIVAMEKSRHADQ